MSYIIAGDEQLDMAEAVRKIGETFKTEEIILGGGGTLNWSMLRDGLCDEVSIVMMPIADGEKHTHSCSKPMKILSTVADRFFTRQR